MAAPERPPSFSGPPLVTPYRANDIASRTVVLPEPVGPVMRKKPAAAQVGEVDASARRRRAPKACMTTRSGLTCERLAPPRSSPSTTAASAARCASPRLAVGGVAEEGLEELDVADGAGSRAAPPLGARALVGGPLDREGVGVRGAEPADGVEQRAVVEQRRQHVVVAVRVARPAREQLGERALEPAHVARRARATGLDGDAGAAGRAGVAGGAARRADLDDAHRLVVVVLGERVLEQRAGVADRVGAARLRAVQVAEGDVVEAVEDGRRAPAGRRRR